MLKHARKFERAALKLLKGLKIHPSETPPLFKNMLNAMHVGHFIAAEPQTYFAFAEHDPTDPKYLGHSHINPQPYHLLQEADALLSVARQKGAAITDFEVFGLNNSKRNDWYHEQRFEIETGKVGVLLPGDINAMWQALNVIRERSENPNVHYTTPIIIQNSGHFWEPLLGTSTASWKKERKALEKMNIHYSAGAAETADILARVTYGKKMAPQDVHLKLTDDAPVAQEDEIFFTTDKIKFGHTNRSQKSFYTGDRLYMGIDVIGPFPSADEQTYSLEGNADDKGKGVYYRHADLFKKIGRKGIEDLYRKAGVKNIHTAKVTVNDGGWGAVLENKKGDRRIDLFPERLFPNTAHKLNPAQMGPGVEYAYMKRTDGLEYMMNNMEARVAEIVEKPGSKFRRSDLTVYDTSVYMSVPLSRMLDAIEAGDDYDAIELGVVTTFSGQKLAIAEQPYRDPYTGVVDTIDYFIPKEPHGNLLTRTQMKDWFMSGPNVESHRMGKMVRNVVARSAQDLGHEKKSKHQKTFNMGMLGSLDALTQRTASTAFTDLKRTLLTGTKEVPSRNANGEPITVKVPFNISTRLGADYWDAYRNRPELVLKQGGADTNSAYMAGTRHMLDASRVFYAGQTSRGDNLSDKQKIKHLLPVIKAIVRNQVFNHIDVVVDAQSAVGKLALDLVRRKQEVGLIQQRTEHLAHFVEGTYEAAVKIDSLVKGDKVSVPPIKRQFFSDGQIENKDCMTAVVYCSATNCNKSLLEQYDRLGYLLAVNGFSLKVGGGNDGLMKAVADGFNKGKKELADKGYDFPNQLILIQCVDTEAIEKRYEGKGLYRCHGAIEPRKADLQQSDIHINGAGGAGSDEEYGADIESRLDGLIDPAKNPMIWFNNQMQTTRGPVGVHDFYRENFAPEFLESVNANTWTLTAEETVAQACAFRAQQQLMHKVSVKDLRASLKDEMHTAAYAKPVGHFRPPFDTWLRATGDLPLTAAALAAKQQATPERQLA